MGFDSTGSLLCSPADILPDTPPQSSGPISIDSCDSATTISDTFICAVNEVRSEAPNAYPPLDSVSWSSSLATIAQNSVELCQMENDPATLSYPDYAATRFSTVHDENIPIEAIEMWGSEREHYNEITGQCDSASGCGHYAMMVSRNVTTIGCGVATASQCGDSYNYAVCLYSPAPQAGVSEIAY